MCESGFWQVQIFDKFRSFLILPALFIGVPPMSGAHVKHCPLEASGSTEATCTAPGICRKSSTGWGVRQSILDYCRVASSQWKYDFFGVNPASMLKQKKQVNLWKFFAKWHFFISSNLFWKRYWPWPITGVLMFWSRDTFLTLLDGILTHGPWVNIFSNASHDHGPVGIHHILKNHSEINGSFYASNISSSYIWIKHRSGFLRVIPCHSDFLDLKKSFQSSTDSPDFWILSFEIHRGLGLGVPKDLAPRHGYR